MISACPPTSELLAAIVLQLAQAIARRLACCSLARLPRHPEAEVCAERLVIEVNGGRHAEQARADTRRDSVLARAGYRVLRRIAR